MEKDTEGKEFPKLLNDKIIRTAKGEVLEELPVWIMRQAGRYLPEYQQTRASVAGFFELCHSSTKSSEVTIQPINRFNLDSAIIFCDILVIPVALGLECIMVEKEGPSFPQPLTTPSDLQRVKNSKEINIKTEFKYVLDALTLTRHQLNGKVPLIGFCGGPWTLMAYMIEGGGSKTFSKAKSWLYRYPNDSHLLLSNITDLIIPYLVEQVVHGAQLLQVFESWAGELSPEAFDEFLLPYLIRIEQSVHERLSEIGSSFVPLIIFPKGAHYSYEKIITKTKYDVISLDWQADVHAIIQFVENEKNNNVNIRPICLQGNLDPSVLFADDDVIRSETKKMIEKFGGFRKGSKVTHICNLGHGLQPTHNPNHVSVFIDAVHQISSELYHQANPS